MRRRRIDRILPTLPLQTVVVLDATRNSRPVVRVPIAVAFEPIAYDEAGSVGSLQDEFNRCPGGAGANSRLAAAAATVDGTPDPQDRRVDGTRLPLRWKTALFLLVAPIAFVLWGGVARLPRALGWFDREGLFLITGAFFVTTMIIALCALVGFDRAWLVPGGLIFTNAPAWRRHVRFHYGQRGTTPLVLDLTRGRAHFLDRGATVTAPGSCEVLYAWLATARSPTRDEIALFLGQPVESAQSS